MAGQPKITLRLEMLLLTLILIVAALAGCDGEAAPEVAASGGLQVWLDQPPDGASIPLGPFLLKAHARDVGGPGVRQIVFLVNAVPVGALDTDPADPLAYAEIEWNPAVPGEYQVQAQAVNDAGMVFSSVARVCVGDAGCQWSAVAEQPSQQPTDVPTPTPTATPEPGITPSPTLPPSATPTSRPTDLPTRTPTPAVCAMVAPIPAAPPNGGVVDNAYPTLSWTYPGRDCMPHGYRIDIATDAGMTAIAQSGGTGNPSTSWAPGQPLADCTAYYWRVAGIIDTTLGPYSAVSSFSTAFPGGCGRPTDTTGPTIRVANAPTQSSYGSYCPRGATILSITADVRDDSGVASVVFMWRYWNQDGKTVSSWLTLNMASAGNNQYGVSFNHNDYPETYNTLGGNVGSLEYIIRATDTSGNVTDFNRRDIMMMICIG